MVFSVVNANLIVVRDSGGRGWQTIWVKGESFQSFGIAALSRSGSDWTFALNMRIPIIVLGAIAAAAWWQPRLLNSAGSDRLNSTNLVAPVVPTRT